MNSEKSNGQRYTEDRDLEDFLDIHTQRLEELKDIGREIFENNIFQNFFKKLQIIFIIQ